MINQELIDYNRRQIDLMKERVYLYREHKISVKQFIDDIDALTAWVKNPPNNWTEKLNGIMWEVEIIYATAQAHNEDIKTEKLQQILRFIDKVEELIFWYEQNCLPSNDDE